MSRRAARFTQADVARAWRAALSVDPKSSVEILPDGRIRIMQGERSEIRPVEPVRDFSL